MKSSSLVRFNKIVIQVLQGGIIIINLQSRTSRIIVDVFMLIFLILSLFGWVGREVFHYIAGSTCFLLFAVHLYINRKWMSSVKKGYRTGELGKSVKRRYRVNQFLIATWSLTFISGLCAMIGHIFEIESLIALFGGHPGLHVLFSRLGLVAIACHVIQHGKQIASYFKLKKSIALVVGTAIAIIAIAAGAFWISFFPSPFANSVSTENISTGMVSMTGDSDVLVAYFSLAGNREYSSDAVDAVSSASLKIQEDQGLGHAEILALAAHETTGGDLFFIEVSKKYPETYGDTMNRHRSEFFEDARPELVTQVEHMDKYNTVVLIYPNWMSRLPQAVLAFLEEYDFSGKKIIPIATSQGLGLGSTPEQITSACPDATVINGLSARSENAVSEFLTEAGLAK
jgi:flavodoxin